MNNIEKYTDVCQSFVVVDQWDDREPVPACEGNPMQLNCGGCKVFKEKGCCPHVLAINHMMKYFNLKHQLKKLPVRKYAHTKGKYANNRKLKKALEREEYPPTESSDEEMEAEHQQLLGGEEGEEEAEPQQVEPQQVLGGEEACSSPLWSGAED